tara:strand:- start:14082 stop:15527 length:1446 start_codon:yes stop_codon:yes gene_type:complete
MSLGNLEDKLRDLSGYLILDSIKTGLQKAKNTAAESKTYPSEQVNLDLKIPSIGISTEINIATLNARVRPQDLITSAGATAAALAVLTGSSKLAGNGELSTTATLPTAEALAAAVQGSTTATSSEVKTIVKTNNTTVSEESLEQLVGNVFQEAGGAFLQLNSILNTITNKTDTFLNSISKGLSSILGDIIEGTFRNVGKAIGIVAINGNGVSVVVPAPVQKEIAGLIEKKEVRAAARLLQLYSAKSLDEITDELKRVKVGAADNLQPGDPPELIAIKVISANTINNKWQEEKTPENSPVFVPVGKDQHSIFSLISDFTNLTRDISTVYVTATGESSLTLRDVHAARVKEKQQGVLDHFFITADGMVTRGRPLSSNPGSTAHAHIIKIGVACKDNMSPSQSRSLKAILETLLLARPGIQIYDIGDFGTKSNLTDFKYWRTNELGYESLPREEIISALGDWIGSNITNISSKKLNRISNGDWQ